MSKGASIGHLVCIIHFVACAFKNWNITLAQDMNSVYISPLDLQWDHVYKASYLKKVCARRLEYVKDFMKLFSM